MEWFEDLPLACPPSDATPCRGEYFRIANGNPATSPDFFSQRKLQPNKILLDYYDEPQLFIARDRFDAQYICLLYSDDFTPKYTAVKISNARLTDFLSGKLDLRQLFVSPEVKGEYYEVAGNDDHLSISPLEYSTLPEERLPEAGYNLDADTQESITVHLPIKDHGLFTELVRKFGWACMYFCEKVRNEEFRKWIIPSNSAYIVSERSASPGGPLPSADTIQFLRSHISRKIVMGGLKACP